jgi:hypothetical protein
MPSKATVETCGTMTRSPDGRGQPAHLAVARTMRDQASWLPPGPGLRSFHISGDGDFCEIDFEARHRQKVDRGRYPELFGLRDSAIDRQRKRADRNALHSRRITQRRARLAIGKVCIKLSIHTVTGLSCNHRSRHIPARDHRAPIFAARFRRQREHPYGIVPAEPWRFEPCYANCPNGQVRAGSGPSPAPWRPPQCGWPR